MNCDSGKEVIEPADLESYARESFRARISDRISSGHWRSRIMSCLKLLGYRDEQWIRVVMNRETLKLVGRLKTEELEALEISGSFWENRCRFKSYTGVQFPEFDICSNILEKKFDLIIAEQVFEHVFYPYQAGKNVHAMLKDGGYFLITVPFLIRKHSFPADCTRWTETGLKYFLHECGFPLELIETGSWGNRACLRKNLRVWWRYHPVLHSLRNEPDVSLNAWALARKLPGL
jgi:SAM-dependent methyltransferase